MLSIGTNADHLKKFIYVTVALFLICLFLIWAAAGFANSSDMVGHIPLAVSGTLLAILGIIKWGWKLGPFPWILGIPVLEGTWTGHLESDWEHGRSNIQQQIPIVFSIRQDLLSLTILSFTRDRHGVSYSAQLVCNDAAKLRRLVYMYSLKEAFRAGEGTQQGAAEIQISGKKKLEMRGEYWTNTKTGGRLILSRCSPVTTDSFEEANEKWPLTNWKNF